MVIYIYSFEGEILAAACSLGEICNIANINRNNAANKLNLSNKATIKGKVITRIELIGNKPRGKGISI